MPVGPPESSEDLVAPRFLVGLHVTDDEEKSGRLHGDGDNGRAMQPHRRQAEMSEHQDIGQHGIHDQHGDGDLEDDAGTADGADQRPDDIVEQPRQHGEVADIDIAARQFRDVRLLSGRQQNLFGIEKCRLHQQPIGRYDPQAHTQRTAHRGNVASAIGLCHQRHDRDGKARTENQDREQELRGKHHCSQLLGAEPADDHHVSGIDAELRQLRADQRNAQRKRCANMCGPRIIIVMRVRARRYRHIHSEDSIFRIARTALPMRARACRINAT